MATVEFLRLLCYCTWVGGQEQPQIKLSQTLLFLLRFVSHFSWINAFKFVICLWLTSGVLKWFFFNSSVQFYLCFLGNSFFKVLIPRFHRHPIPCWLNFYMHRILMYFWIQNYTKRSSKGNVLPSISLPSWFPPLLVFNQFQCLLITSSVWLRMLSNICYWFLISSSLLQKHVVFCICSFVLCFCHLAVSPRNHSISIHRELSLPFLQLHDIPWCICSTVFSSNLLSLYV